MDEAADSFFEALPLFRNLTPPQLLQARALFHSQRVRANHTLTTEEQPGEIVYIIVHGSVKICTQGGAVDTVIGLRGPGEIIGEMSVLDGVGRSAMVIAQEPSLLFWVSRADFWNVLWEMPPIPYNLACLLAQRVRQLTSQVQAMATLDVQGRLARQLVTLADEHGRPCDGPHPSGAVIIPFQLKQAELAGMVGATREQVNRLLATWIRHGLVSRKGAYLVLYRRDAL
ncbi:MAG: Crp/Fnr family transcriptional regulator [Armatimonadetes bacterium]|nr:Crp/Fnr family transcriptional regulator [Armatimonadota bacterium]